MREYEQIKEIIDNSFYEIENEVINDLDEDIILNEENTPTFIDNIRDKLLDKLYNVLVVYNNYSNGVFKRHIEEEIYNMLETWNVEEWRKLTSQEHDEIVKGIINDVLTDDEVYIDEHSTIEYYINRYIDNNLRNEVE